MTVLDFRSGGYADSRDGYAAAQDGDAYASHWHSHYQAGVPDAHAWQAADDWDDARYAAETGAARLRDSDGVMGRVARLTHYLGAVASIGLMGTLGVWGYQLVMRDVSGVPVIRAVEGDARVAPAEPGGELTERTGLAVNQVAGGTEAAPVETVAIAPAPTALDGQDVAMGELGATAQDPSVVSDEPVADPSAATVAMTDAESARLAAVATDEGAADQAGVPAVAPMEADSVAASAAVTDVAGQPTQDTAITAALAEAGAVPAVTTPTRPLPRPRRIAAASSAPVATDATAAPVAAETAAEPVPDETPEAAAEPAPVKTATVASGAPLVQIGAFDSGSIAESEWARVSGRYGDLFSGKAPVVQEHKAGGRTFYRLRVAGFESRDEARKFCAALIAAGADCIPAVAK